MGAVCLLLVVTVFHQDPGRIGNDTKLDLTADPGGFLSRALYLWDPSAAFGRLQNQAYGYLFPMGPFHWLGIELGIPAWVVQRSWMALLLVVAFLGTVRLADRMGLGTPGSRLLGGLAYAISPRFLTLLGGNSAELWPMALLPWVVLPLVGPGARLQPRRSAMRSGVAILCMGAANATTVLALLPLPALLLSTGLRDAAGRRLAAWWSLAVVLACAWWFGPLVLQGRYSSDFLAYIETARTTTTFTGPAQALSGTSHWVSYLSIGGVPWWRSGWMLVNDSTAVLDVGLLAALGVVGLLSHRMPRQGRLALVAGLGLLAMATPHVGPLDGPLAHQAQDLLDGGLAAFRNVHKFDGLVRLPLALGVCHLLSQVTATRVRQLLSGVTVVALVGAGSPALAGQLVPTGSYTGIPSWWVQAGHWLDDHDATGHTLVVPASGFGEYYWGRPLDNPLQALTTTSWAVRDAVPLGSPGNTRLLDAIEKRLDSGQGSAGLSAVLARMGVSYLVVSGDLASVGTPRPVVVQQALDRTPGLELAATFGPPHGGDPYRPFVGDGGLGVTLPTLQVFRVAGADTPVTSLPATGTWQVSGGPESLFALADRGLLDHRATVLSGDPLATATGSRQTVLTDDLRRREVNFGQVRDNESPTLSAAARPTIDRAPIDVLPVPGSQHLATSMLLGAEAVEASSSASDVMSLLHTGPENGPLSAFDGDLGTTWLSGSLEGAAGQWVQLTLKEAVDPAGATITPGPGVTEVTVTTDRGRSRTSLDGSATTQPLATPEGSTRWLRVTVTKVAQDGFGAKAAISDVTVPGVSVRSTVVLADDQHQSADPVVLLDRAVGARGGCAWSDGRAICAPSLSRVAEDDVALDRIFRLDRPQVLPVTGTALPVPGAALDGWLDRGLGVRVTASSRLVVDPAVRPAQVLDGRASTGWIAGVGDEAPSLSLSWKGPRRIDRLTLTTDDALVAARPLAVRVITTRGTSDLEVPKDGVLTFPAQTTDRLELRFTRWETRTSVDLDGSRHALPVGLSELSVPALRGLVKRPPAGTATVSLPCGAGPAVTVDGRPHATAVLGSRVDLEQLQPLLLGVCELGGVSLGSGEHRVLAGTRGAFRVQSLELGRAAVATAGSGGRPVVVRTWDRERRIVDVAPGPESYVVVHENFNRGWRAELAGTPLTPVRLDGWQQAWLVPEGKGGQVTMTFGPGRTFHLVLAVGALLVLLLLALAVVPSRARDAAPERETAGLPVVPRVAVATAAVVVVGGVPALIGYVVLVAGVLLSRALRDATALLSGAALLGSAALTALDPWGGSSTPALLRSPATACALLAVAAAAAVLSVPRSPSDASGSEPAAPPASS